MKRETAFKIDVFPDAVPPAKMMLLPFSIASQKYASISMLHVPNPIRSIGVIGSPLNLRMVNELPRVVTSLPSVACSREPSTM
ncbi:MAG: hypothetical protein ACXQTY_04850 [Candidatus Methanogasteraceae archaeon]